MKSFFLPLAMVILISLPQNFFAHEGKVETDLIVLLAQHQVNKEQREHQLDTSLIGSSKAEVIKLCGYPDLTEIDTVFESGVYIEVWTYFFEDGEERFVEFFCGAGKATVKNVTRKQ